MGTQKADICRHQLQIAEDAGFQLAAYAWNHPSWGSGREAVDRSLARIAGFNVSFLAIDVEEDEKVYWSREWPRLVAEMVVACQESGILPIIYTSRSMWLKLMANTTDYAHLLLWDASYGNGPFVPYGGWSSRALWQYAGTVEMCGTTVDLNRV